MTFYRRILSSERFSFARGVVVFNAHLLFCFERDIFAFRKLYKYKKGEKN